MGQAFFPKDVKRHWTAGIGLVKDLARQFEADFSEDQRHVKLRFPNGRVLRYTFLDLQFNTVDQFKHDTAKAAKDK